MTDTLTNDESDLELQGRGYDKRYVPYEEIHNIRDEDFESLVEAVDPEEGDYILDAGAGYGAVTREIVQRTKLKDLRFCLLDISSFQIQRGIKHLSDLFGEDFMKDRSEFLLDSVLHPNYQDNCFDKVVAKMVIHELPKRSQVPALKELYRVLKPGGKIIIWDIMLDDATQEFFQDVIRKKDTLAEFHYLAKYRYFLTEAEWTELLRESGFKRIERHADVLYDLHTSRRLFAELGGDRARLNQWHEFIRERVSQMPEEVLRRMNYKDDGDDIGFTPPKAIYTAFKE
jgi:ubiquinone/menaquinone biosynthesis C-methylase UbiE